MRALKRDLAEPEIVEALEKSGCLVFRLHTPADLLVFKPTPHCSTSGDWYVLEVKSRKRKDQPKQDEFRRLTGTPVVKDAREALEAMNLVPWQVQVM